MFRRNNAIAAASGASGYHILKPIVHGGTEGWGYTRIDSVTRRLYIGRAAHMEVVDIERSNLVLLFRNYAVKVLSVNRGILRQLAS